MANVIVKEFYNIKNGQTYEIIPLGDVHLGAKACLEAEFKEIVEYIANNPNAFWIGMGDYCDFINMSDPRFDPRTLASWIEMKDLKNLATVQKEQFVQLIKPIAKKCLGLVKGNHEDVIERYYEYDIYSAIVNAIKEAAGLSMKDKLALGMYGWLILKLYTGPKKEGSRNVKFNLHHGFTGGRLAGAKALNMQRWLWSHAADVTIWGHTHNKMTQAEAIESVDSRDKIIIVPRLGVISGTYMASTVEEGNTYAENKGYLPLPAGDTPRIYITIKAGRPRAIIKAIT